MTQIENMTTVQILDNRYHFRCESNQEEAVFQAALLLDAKMREIRELNSNLSMERIAVMAALNVCHDFLRYQAHCENSKQALKQDIQSIIEKIANELVCVEDSQY
ncbi:MAG: cell division protein ZapA [Legionellales bacterium]|nr:cell division protein ZapA [Legionellales bacterium]